MIFYNPLQIYLNGLPIELFIVAHYGVGKHAITLTIAAGTFIG